MLVPEGQPTRRRRQAWSSIYLSGALAKCKEVSLSINQIGDVLVVSNDPSDQDMGAR